MAEGSDPSTAPATDGSCCRRGPRQSHRQCASAKGLRGYAGLAPLPWESGTSRQVTHRRICNRRLKTACHYWAFSALTRSPGARARYDHRRAQGDS